VRYQADRMSSAVPAVAPAAPSLTQIAPTELDELFATCMPKLAKTARRLARTAEDSEDLLQDSLLSAFKNLHQFQGRSKFATWVYSIVRNNARMRFRKAVAHRYCSLEAQISVCEELPLESASAPSPDAEETCIENERSRILRKMLRTVPPGYRTVLQLCKDAAEQLGMTLSSLKTRLHRARKSVAAKIRRYCGRENLLTASTESRGAEFLTVPVHSDAGTGPKRKSAGAYDELRPVPRRPSQGSYVSMPRKVAVGVRHERPKTSPHDYGMGANRSTGACSLSGAL
jgi:RNA polymerase sigma-70 factor, ECF subfamily